MKTKKFPISAVIIEFVVIILIVYTANYNNKFTWYGFSVDENELLYISQTGEIDVIDQGHTIRILDVPTTRGFQFTIENGNTIAVYTGAHSYKLDLDGNILQEAELTWNPGIEPNGPFTSKNGLTYHMTSFWGRPQIVLEQNGVDTVIYQMPLISYLGRILYYLLFIGQTYCIFIFFNWKYNINDLLKRHFRKHGTVLFR